MKKIMILLSTTFLLSAQDIGISIAFKAKTLVGIHYTWGGTDLKNGLDCSAMVQQIYKRFGYKIPRTAEQQAMQSSCKMITDLSQVKIGDALYFKNNKGHIHHVAIVTGHDKFGKLIITHAKGKKYGVVQEKLSEKYITEFIGAKRFYQCLSPQKSLSRYYLKPIIIKATIN